MKKKNFTFLYNEETNEGGIISEIESGARVVVDDVVGAETWIV